MINQGSSELVDDFLSLAVLRYEPDDGPDRWRRARELASEHPDLGEVSLYAAAALSDPELIARHLAADPSAVGRAGGPQGWTPLLYFAYARVRPESSAADSTRSLSILLEHGADPNDSYRWHGLTPPFTVLAGLFGDGEQGNERQPPHPHAVQLASVLLEAGADPNDGQALYNRMFSPADDHLELLLHFGLGAADEAARALVRSQLVWAITHAMTSRIKLLAAHGVDLDSPLDGVPCVDADPPTPVQLAMQCGESAVAQQLVDLGAAPATDLESVLLAALLTADDDQVSRLDTENPGALERIQRSRPSLVLWAAVLDRPETIRLLVRLGFDVNAYGRQDLPFEQEWETALHRAAGEGKLEVARTLVELGADADLRDHRFRGTPLDWARHSGRSELISLLKPRTN